MIRALPLGNFTSERVPFVSDIKPPVRQISGAVIPKGLLTWRNIYVSYLKKSRTISFSETFACKRFFGGAPLPGVRNWSE
jgi:hypothetical protein